MDEHGDEHQRDPDAPDNDGGRLFVTLVDGTWYALPATIAGIRESLPEDQRAKFMDEIEHAPARDMPLTLYRWAAKPTPVPAAMRRIHDWVQGIHEEAEAAVVMGVERADVLDQVDSRLREGPPQSSE
ncbi:hypothetical protein [Embleya sp. NPDC020886]|uniref:hypothetical protein n=1 Tax=Embleya sp. NPDC020886 TaxID=3363980 RepID=UPI0037B98F50